MEEGNKYLYLFKSNGCITVRAMQDYLLNYLSPDEKHMLSKHAESCPFCHDAMEGYWYLKNKKTLLNSTFALNRAILKTTRNPGIPNQIAYFASAATVLLLIGISVIYWYYLPAKDNRITAQNLKLPPPSVPEKAGASVNSEDFANSEVVTEKGNNHSDAKPGRDEKKQANSIVPTLNATGEIKKELPVEEEPAFLIVEENASFQGGDISTFSAWVKMIFNTRIQPLKIIFGERL